MDVIPVAVIGVGAMGQNHARVLNDMEGVELVGVCDANDSQAEAIGRRFRVPHYNNHQLMLTSAKPAVVVIAAPTTYHREMTLDTLEYGAHVLVEKPIAFTVEEAREMIIAARRAKLLLGVGHIERFNPAIIEMKRRIALGELGTIFMIHSKRQSPLPRRICDVGVGMDLATHELDMMRFITSAKVMHLSAEVSQVTNANTREDIIFALLRFETGVLGVLDVNWVTPTQVREISVTGEKGMFVANYHTQELCFFQNPASTSIYSPELTNWTSQREFSVEAGNMIKFQMAKQEPLRNELVAFINAVRSKASTAPCPGEDGLEALQLALQIVAGGQMARMVANGTEATIGVDAWK
jgi:predicted dehydrogenase